MVGIKAKKISDTSLNSHCMSLTLTRSKQTIYIHIKKKIRYLRFIFLELVAGSRDIHEQLAKSTHCALLLTT